jgi:nucleoside-diphosphate-sugar epimerase
VSVRSRSVKGRSWRAEGRGPRCSTRIALIGPGERALHDVPHTGDGRRVLVTGGSGFIGTHVVSRLLASGADVVSLDRSPPKEPDHLRHWQQVDVVSTALARSVEAFQPTHIVHLAARTDLDGESMDDYAVNIDGVRAVLAAAGRSTSLQRSVFASSRIVCDLGVDPVSDYDYCPPNFYGRTKVIGEQLVRAHAHTGSWVIVRPTSIWGPWGGTPYREFFLSLAGGRYIHPGQERILKHYGYVGNVAYQVDRLLTAPDELAHGRTFYLADFEPIDVLDFATRIRGALGLPPPRSAPVPLLRALALSMDAAQAAGIRHPPLTRSRLNNLRTEMLFDLHDLEAVVGPLPFTLEDGIRATVAHLRSQGAIRPAG